MNKYVLSETNQHVMRLIQMGADVQVVSSQMVYVTFDITQDVKVSYVYNINKKNRYFLERIKPYPLPVKEFESAEDICNIIKIDVEQFKNAAKSKNMKDFIETNSELHNILLMYEDLFLYYNVAPETIQGIKKRISQIHMSLADAKATAERVYFKKEPDHLDDLK